MVPAVNYYTVNCVQCPGASCITLLSSPSSGFSLTFWFFAFRCHLIFDKWWLVYLTVARTPSQTQNILDYNLHDLILRISEWHSEDRSYVAPSKGVTSTPHSRRWAPWHRWKKYGCRDTHRYLLLTYTAYFCLFLQSILTALEETLRRRRSNFSALIPVRAKRRFPHVQGHVLQDLL